MEVISKHPEYVKEYNQAYYKLNSEKSFVCPDCLATVKQFSKSKHLKSRYHNLALALIDNLS
jgi:protein-arginine kinase activator protein McsA